MSGQLYAVLAYSPGHPSRARPFGLVLQMFAELGWPIVIADQGGEPYNVGHAKNAGVRSSFAQMDDVLVLADADCIAAPEALREAVWRAYTQPGIVWTADRIRILEQAATDELRSPAQALGSWSGELRPADATPQLLAVRRDCFEQVGGYDESYVGYGFEDYDFRARCETLWPSRRVAGTLVHLWHEPEPAKVAGRADPHYRANENRWLAAGAQPWNE